MKKLFIFSLYLLIFHSSGVAQADIPPPAANMYNLPAGSYVIPMDNSKQALSGTPFNLAAYGLVHQIISNGIPVYWVIRSGKGKDEIDFTVQSSRVAPTAVASANIDFRASAFVIDEQFLNPPEGCNPQIFANIDEIISNYGNNVAVYSTDVAVNVDVRYTLTIPPKIAVLTDGQIPEAHYEILDEANVPYELLDYPTFSTGAECYSFISQPHLGSDDIDNSYTTQVQNFVNAGGNFFAQCDAAGTFEDVLFFQTTGGINQAFMIAASDSIHTFHNSDMPVAQFEGEFADWGWGGNGHWTINGTMNANSYKVVTGGGNCEDNILLTGSDQNGATLGGNVFYMSGHEFHPGTQVMGNKHQCDVVNNCDCEAFGVCGTMCNNCLGGNTCMDCPCDPGIGNGPSYTANIIESYNTNRAYLNAAFVPANISAACAGPDQCICPGDSVQLGCLLPSSIGYTWTPATGLSCTNCDNPMASPSVTTTYIATPSIGNCGTDTVIVSVKECGVNVTLVGDSICDGECGNLTATTSGGEEPITFEWGNGITNTDIGPVNVCPTTTTTYTIIATDATGEKDTATADIIIYTPPTLVMDPDVTICPDTDPSANIGVTPNGTGPFTYSWTSNPVGYNSTDQSPLITPSSGTATTTTTYIVEVTDANGCVSVDSMLFNTNCGIDVQLTGDTICIGECGTLTATASGGDEPYSFEWDNGITNTDIGPVNVCPTTTTTYTVILTDASGKKDTATVDVIVNNPPTLVMDPNVVICPDDNPSANIGVTPTGSDPYTYSWTSNPVGTPTFTSTEQSPIITPSGNATATTTYIVEVTDANGCVSIDSMLFTVTCDVYIELTGDTACFGECVNLTASAIGGDEPYTFEWNNGITNTDIGPINVCPTTTTTYTVIVTDANGKKDTATADVIIHPLPIITAGPDQTICIGESATLTAGGGISYNWNTGDTTEQISVSPTSNTDYIVTGTDINGCVNTDTTTVFVNPLPTPDAGLDTAICIGESAQLNATGGVSYTWTPDNAGLNNTTIPNPIANPTVTTKYFVNVIDTNGCENIDSITVIINPLPIVDAGPDVTICLGTSTQLNATGGILYVWTPDNAGLDNTTIPDPNASPIITTTYGVSVTDINGCVNTDTVTVNVVDLQLTIDAGPDQTLCEGIGTTIAATGGVGGESFSWTPINGLTDPNAQQTEANPDVTTTYHVSITDSCGNVYTDSVTIVINPTPVVDFTPDTTEGCKPLCVNFTNHTPFSASCSWNFGDGNRSTECNPYHCYTDAGVFDVELTVIDSNGCTASLLKPELIHVYDFPIANFEPSPVVTSKLDPLITFTDKSIDASCWQWDFGDSTLNDNSTQQHTTHTYQDTGKYDITLIVCNETGCYDTITKSIYITDYFTVYVPNVFTPDGDGVNDFFYPVVVGEDKNTFEFLVFNRWGELIFESNHPNIWWDGTYKNIMSQQDVYVWKLMVKDKYTEEVHKFIGHVSILR